MAKKYKITIKPEALKDLDEIYQFIAKDSVQQAKKFHQNLKKKIKELDTFPRRGAPLVTEIDEPFEELRFVTYKGYIIVYEIDGLNVLILNVFAPGRNWWALLI